MKKYICYDGVDNDLTRHDTEEEAITALEELISDHFDNEEFTDGIEWCFVAKITHKMGEGIEIIKAEE